MPYKDIVKRRAAVRKCRLKHLPKRREYQRNYYRKNPVIYLLNACRCRARKQGIPFDLTAEDIIIPKTCPVFGIPLFHGTKGFHENSPSIDKIIPEKGYVKGNVVVISFKANRMKQNATTQELIRLSNFFEKLERENDPSPIS